MTRTTGLRWCTLALLVTAFSANAQDVFDTDGDGVDDNIDNCTLTANPAQMDSDGDFNGNMCDADFNNDLVVNATDLGIMRTNFFSSNPMTDINADGVTNAIDLGLMKAMFFSVPGPTGTDPDQPPCTCYFSNDCPSGTFCDYGPGSFSTEDICVWRDIKPDGTVGAGCSIESDLTTGAWTPDICDGVCSASVNGSTIGLEDHNMVTQAIQFWGDAMLNPSEAGGGPVDPTMASRALALNFSVQDVALVVGRQAADALAMAAGEPFHNYFCHYEGHPEDGNPPVVNLAGDSCRVAAGRITINALVSEIQTPGAAKEIMQDILNVCPTTWQQMFATQCDAGPGALACATQFIAAQAHFLRTPPVANLDAPDAIELLLNAQR